MTRLGEILEALTTEDGSPDYAARGSELSGLIRYLTESEIQDLRTQLNSRIIPNDPCKRFPVEIVQEIAKYLSLEEVIRARHVSRSWLAVLGGNETSQNLLKWHFPLIWERDHKDFWQAEHLPTSLNPKNVLLAQAEKSARCKLGLYLSTATYQLPTKVHSFEYCNGRIAFQADSAGDPIQVWNLRSNVRRTYVDENRESLYMWELSDRFLICQKRRPLRLVVWDLNLPDPAEPMEIHLPNRLHGFWARQNRVAIISSTFELMIWQWGGQLRKINTSELSRTLDSSFTIEELDIYFHPYNTDKIYIVVQVNRDNDSEQRQVTIFECTLVENEWQLKPACKMGFQIACMRTPHRPKLVRSSSPTTAIGIFVGVKVPEDNGRCHQCPIKGGHRVGNDDDTLSEILCEYSTFDMLTGETETYTYRFPKWAEHQYSSFRYIEDVVLFRKDQLLFPVQKAEIFIDDNAGAGIVAIKSLPNDVAQMEKQASLESKPESELIKSWIGGTVIASPNPDDPGTGESSWTAPFSVKGDEDFVILFRKDNFVVWCFDETVVLPQSLLPE